MIGTPSRVSFVSMARCLLVLLLLCFLLGDAGVFGQSSQREKLRKILSNRAGQTRMVPATSSEPTKLKFGITLVSMSDFQPALGTMNLGYWLKLKWNDKRWKWNPLRNGNIKMLRVPAADIWVPDVGSYTAGSDSDSSQSYNAVVDSDGSFIWVPKALTTITCKEVADGPAFPNDQRQCRVRFGSWTYSSQTLNLTLDKQALMLDVLDTTALTSSGWEYVSSGVVRQEKKYECCPDETYPSVDLTILIRRVDRYYSLAVAAPGVITGLLVALLYLVVPCSPARIIAQSVCLLILVLVAVTDLRVMGTAVIQAPVAKYFIAAMGLNLLALAWSIIAGVIWIRESASPKNGKGKLDSVMSKLACICLLPPSEVKSKEGEEVDLDAKEGGKCPRYGILSGTQRLFLFLDRLLCLINIVVFIVFFICFGV